MNKIRNLEFFRCIIAFVLVFSMAASFTLVSGFADDTDDDEYEETLDELNREKEEATNNRIAAEQKLSDLQGQKEDLSEEKMVLEERNIAMQDEIDVINKQIELYNEQIADKQAEVDAAQLTVDEQLARYRVRVRAMEESNGYNILDIILSSSSFAELLSAIDDYSQIMQNDEAVYADLQAARADHQELLDELTALRDDYEAQKADLQSEIDALEQEISDSEEQIAELISQISEAEDELLEYERAEEAASYAAQSFIQDYLRQKAQAETEKEVEQDEQLPVIVLPTPTPVPDSSSSGEQSDSGNSSAEQTDSGNSSAEQTDSGNSSAEQTDSGNSSAEQADSGNSSGGQTDSGNSSAEQTDSGNSSGGQTDSGNSSGGQTASGSASGSSSSQTSYATGSFIWPFPGHYGITSTYGYRESTGTTHTGIDIDGYQSMGSPIVAADGGTVIMAEYYGNYGNCIIIDHGNGYMTLYAHLSSMSVGVGSVVTQGQTIAGVGNTGRVYGADGIHLHFEVYLNGYQTNPLSYLSGYYFVSD